MNSNISSEKNNQERLYYLVVSLIAINVFYSPILRTQLTACALPDSQYFSSYNYFITNYAIYLKLIIFAYVLNNVHYILNNLYKLTTIHFFITYLLIQSLITANTIIQIINILNTLLIIYFVYVSIKKNLISTFIKYLIIYLSITIILSALLMFFDLNGLYFTKCYTSKNILFGMKSTLNLVGFTDSKNTLGANIFILNFLLLYFYNFTKNDFKIKISILLFSIYYIYYIDSISPLLLTSLLLLSLITKNNKKIFIFTIFFIILLGYFFYGEILNLLSRDATLSGRIYLWQTMLNEIKSFPILGNGINNYGFVVDNTFLKLLFDCGIIFTSIYIGWLIKRSYHAFIDSKKIDFSIIFFYVLVYSFSEGIGLFYSTNLVIITMFMSYFTAEKKEILND